jgi:DNA-binding CsgD family transcriptional regulator
VAGTDEDATLDVVERGLDARLLAEASGGHTIRFAHALIRETLYEGIPAVRSRRIHRRVAEALAASEHPDPDAVAYHFQQVGDHRAVGWLIAAGERAQRAVAVDSAVGRYEAAVALLQASGAEPAQCGWLLYRLALLHRFTDHPRSIADAEEALALAVAHGDRVLAAVARFARTFLRADNGDRSVIRGELAASVDALEALTPEEHARLNTQDGMQPTADDRPWRGTLIFHLALAGYYAEAVEMGERFLSQTIPPTAGGMLRGFAHGGGDTGVGIAHGMQGRPDAARRAFARARMTFETVGSPLNVAVTNTYDLRFALLPYQADRVGDRRNLAAAVERAVLRAVDFATDSYVQLCQMPLPLLEGDWDAAHAALRAFRDSRHGGFRQHALIHLIALLRDRGEAEEATALVRELLPGGVETEPGSVAFDYVAEGMRLAALLRLDAGDLGGAKTWLHAHDRFLAWNDAVLGRADGALIWARHHREAGDTALAHACATEALAQATDPRQPLAVIAAHRLLGEVDTDAGRYDDAARHFNESLQLTDACGAPYERALTLLAMAELQAAQRANNPARTLLDEVRAICGPLGAKPALARADALAARLAPTQPVAPAYPAGLSAREVEVLRLVAQGLTNPQVAERLFLSPRTVEHHLHAIFNKTGVSTRAAAARWATEHALG